MKKTARLSVIIEEQVKLQLERLAEEGQCSVAAVIRKLVVGGLSNKRGK